MALPQRGTGLLTGRARTERGMGWPLTDAERRERHYGIENNPSLPYRGTGLVTGRARTVRGGGIPLTEAERLERHYATEGMIDPLWIIAGSVVVAGAIIWAVGALSKP